MRLVLLTIQKNKKPVIERFKVTHFEVTEELELIAYREDEEVLYRDADEWHNLTFYRS